MAKGVNIVGRFDDQELRTGFMMMNQQLLQANLNLERVSKSLMTNTMRQKGSANAAKGSAKAMAGLALRFVGYNLVLNQVMGAQQKVIEFVKESVTKFREFETRLAEVSTILGDDVDQMSRFKAGIESLATSYGQATSDISKGLYDILSAAFNSSDAMNLLNTSIKASIAGLSEVRTSVDIFTTILNSYGMEVEQATHVSDVLFQSVIRGKFQFKDLEQALGYVVPIASQAGLSFDELTAALSTATRHGLHLDMTSRGLALAIQGIVNPSEKAKKAALEYDVEMSGLALRVMGLKGWFDQLGKAMEKHGKSILGDLIPNMRSLRVAMVLAGEEGAKGFADDLEYLEDVTGKTEVALGKMMETSGFVAKQIGQEMEAVSREVGEDWDEAMLGMKQGLVEIASNWTHLIPVIGTIIGTVDKLNEQVRGNWEAATANIYRYIDGQNNVTHNLRTYLKLKEDEEALAKSIYSKMGKDEDYTSEYEDMKFLVSLEPLLEGVWNTFIGGIQTSQQELARLETVLDEVTRDITRLNKSLFDVTEYGTYGKTIEGTINLQMEQLEATKLQKDAQHDVKMGLKDATYEWYTNNEALEAAVKIVREHKEATKKDRYETDLMAVSLRHLQIQMLEIQLAGMMRRRGLTRAEEKKMKQIQIEQAKLRLENMKSTHEQTVEMVEDYDLAQATIDEYLAKVEEETYQLKYTYKQQITDLGELIEKEKTDLELREDWHKETNLNIATEGQKLYDALVTIFEDDTLNTVFEQAFDIPIEEKMASVLARIEAAIAAGDTSGGKDGWVWENGRWVLKDSTPTPTPTPDDDTSGDTTPEPTPEPEPKSYEVRSSNLSWDKLQDMWKVTVQSTSGTTKRFRKDEKSDAVDILGRYPSGKILNWKRGVEHVPYDMVAQIHRGESIVPAGKNVSGGGTTIENVTINVRAISDIDSVEKMGAVLGAVKQTGLTDRRGKVKYRLM